MKNNFIKFIPEIIKYEGSVYENHPADPGGPTKYGITIYDIGIREGLNVKSNWSKLDKMVKNLTLDEATAIYRTKYWDKVKGDELNSGVDCIICDHGINCGPSKAIRIAQKISGADIDGKIGEQTITAVNKMDPKEFIEKFSEARISYYKSLRHFKTFGRGWLRRVENCKVFCLKLTSSVHGIPDVSTKEILK